MNIKIQLGRIRRKDPMMMNIKICRCTLWLRFILSEIEYKALSSGVESPTAVDDQSPERPDFGTILWRENFSARYQLC